MWKISSGLLHFCTSDSSKNQPHFSKKANGQAFRSAEVQKSTREFSHGLVFRCILLREVNAPSRYSMGLIKNKWNILIEKQRQYFYKLTGSDQPGLTAKDTFIHSEFMWKCSFWPKDNKLPNHVSNFNHNLSLWLWVSQFYRKNS